MKRLQLVGAVAVVTGAASGIGRATARAAARRGVAAVALVDRDAAGLADAADEIRALGASASTHAVDVTDADAVAALPEAVVAAHGRVDLLVTAAGVILVGRFEETSMEEFRWLVEINLFGTVATVHAFLPHLRRAPGGAQIATISSLFGIVAPAEQTAYATSKFAVRGFSEALRHELTGSTVGLTVVHPGGVDTHLTRNGRLAAAADPADAARKAEAFHRLFLTTPPDVVGEAIVRAAERRRPRLLTADFARTVATLQRLLPVRYWRLLGLPYRRLARG